MAQFVGKPLPDFMVKPLAGGALGAKTSLKGLAAGRPLVRSRRVRLKKDAALFVSAKTSLERDPTSDVETGQHTGHPLLQRWLRRMPPLRAADGALAARHGAACVFACVCVEGEYVAREFARLYLHTATNCVVEGPDIPQIPLQLGCSGFVVVDGDGNIVTTKTKSLLDYGEVAFRDADAKLAVLLGGDSLPVGTAVELTGLSNDAFNGRRGIVTETPAPRCARPVASRSSSTARPSP